MTSRENMSRQRQIVCLKFYSNQFPSSFILFYVFMCCCLLWETTTNAMSFFYYVSLHAILLCLFFIMVEGGCPEFKMVNYNKLISADIELYIAFLFLFQILFFSPSVLNINLVLLEGKEKNERIRKKIATHRYI